MNKRVLTAAVLLALPLLQVVPAHAMKGIDAARSCEARPGCKVVYDNSGGSVIVIIVDGTTIVCPTPLDECEVWKKGGGSARPNVNIDGLLADPGRAGGNGKPGGIIAPVAPGLGGLTVQR